ncbi:MAG: hypothetical protein COU63_02300 [Candidatus Pacebacteria bacterium CG10_big_fil_rev_8_21_14_0_10_36_11]|nr:hypothetical protein [Candidatus Pacearchaeota archaeon]OIP73595.1 MAG: hypothetical protein AUK08_03415 [Candidatus Pacebacteria bacterium CG2_30_36_39]PIR64824.1 MAG: hypothetical protein COU63_02300 [Candidatus Pacebacteria bacterium CG10_big_fil_rev_8_21_14_0_10_36_11]PJC42590.1 MAG: hypothetical protein CO040_03665 [Candidatus Pacebacteria bacterium CG_4_9_14_0_2_um_filter_36_8]
MSSQDLIKKVKGGLLITIGFILSPLSWWNDLVVNFPLSYIIALPIGLINQSFFLPAFIAAYWLTNILGLLFIHLGSKKIVETNEQKNQFNVEVKKTLFWSFLYTILIVVLILTGILTVPTELLDKISK